MPPHGRNGDVLTMDEMKNYEFLTGDVNPRKYGGIWYKRLNNSQRDIDITMGGKRFVVPVSDYKLIETINFPEATGEKINGKEYYGQVVYIDLTAEAWSKNIVSALDCIGWNDANEPLTETMILDAIMCYMGGDREMERTSNNYNEMLKELKGY